MNYNINEQKLGFDRVLPWEGQVPALVKEGEHYFLQVKAPSLNGAGERCERDLIGAKVFEEEGGASRADRFGEEEKRGGAPLFRKFLLLPNYSLQNKSTPPARRIRRR